MPWFSRESENTEWNKTAPGRPESERKALAFEDYGSLLWDTPLDDAKYFVIDIETSGFSAQRDIVLSVATASMTFASEDQPRKRVHYELVGHTDTSRVPEHIWDLTGLAPHELAQGRAWREVLYDTLQRSTNHIWVAHHARHELSFLQRYAREFWRLRIRPIVIDTALVAQALFQTPRVPTLEELCNGLDIPIGVRHRADEDVQMTAQVWQKEAVLCQSVGLTTVGEVIEWTLARAHGS